MTEATAYNMIGSNQLRSPSARDAQLKVLPCGVKEMNAFLSMKCSSCRLYLRNPVYICNIGHNYCKFCYEKESVCKVCNGHFVLKATMEQIAEVPCKFSKFGCPNSYPINLKKEHETSCHYRILSCPIKKCPEKGLIHHLKIHILRKHKPSRDSFSVSLRENCLHKHFIELLECDGNIFILNVDIEDDQFCASVQLLGEPAEAETFTYTLEVQKGEQTDIHIRNVTTSYKEAKKVVVDSGKCVRMPFRCFRQFLCCSEPDKVTVHVKIHGPGRDDNNEKIPNRKICCKWFNSFKRAIAKVFRCQSSGQS